MSIRIFLVALLLFPAAARAAIIGIDNLHTTSLGSDTRFSGFRDTIAAAGHTLVQLSAFASGNLAGLDAVVVRQSSSATQIFSATEIAALQSFVISGRGLIVIGEGGFASDSTTGNLNTLVAPCGVTYGPTAVDGSGFTITNFAPHAVTLGIGSVSVDFHRPFTSISTPALDLTPDSGSNDFLAVVDGGGVQGNVLMISDTSLWGNPGGVGVDANIDLGDNRRLLQNAIGYVVPVPEPATALLYAFGVCVVAAARLRRAG